MHATAAAKALRLHKLVYPAPAGIKIKRATLKVDLGFEPDFNAHQILRLPLAIKGTPYNHANTVISARRHLARDVTPR